MNNNTNHLIALLTAARDAHDFDIPDTSSTPLYRAIHDLMLAASNNLSNALTESPDRYYFSDSQFDEYSNAATTITTCDTFLCHFLDAIPITDDMLSDLADAINYYCDYFNELPMPDTFSDLLDELRALTD